MESTKAKIESTSDKTNDSYKQYSDKPCDDKKCHKPCNCKGLKIATALTTIIALAGIGFGIYGMLQSSNKDQQISDLEKEKSTATTVETTEVKVSDATPTTETSTATTTIKNTEEYLYIGDWGLKIKIGNDYKIVKTALSPDDSGESIGITVTNPNQFKETIQTVQNIDTLPYMTFIERSKKPDFKAYGYAIEPSYNDGEYYYYVFQTSGVGITGLTGSLWDDFVSANENFINTVRQSSNYSSI